MGAATGQSLPIAVGVLVSPLPIVAVVLMLTSGRARANATAFLLGWFLAVGVVALGVALLAGTAAGGSSGPPAWLGWAKLALGVLLLVAAARQWRARPAEGAEPAMPRWMTTIDSFTPVRALGLAVLLSVVNPKNLLLVVSGAAAIAGATDDPAAKAGAAVVFAVVASLGVAAPVAVYVLTGDRATALLDGLKSWLTHNNTAVMAVLLLVLGAKMIGDGISAL
ncbi:GAP family protein [Myceligenerans indicum]|uniref:GAP family protein n=1 Tax=Myceligenerans indicum TaxID=2593663 RepID=A0ABS1LG07_9MICO|nr:GAP family protein [Myceligenerans indicum]MBL0885131.1 GAP family protein [Myceligenerans indicum]